MLRINRQKCLKQFWGSQKHFGGQSLRKTLVAAGLVGLTLLICFFEQTVCCVTSSVTT